jgi:hypothetical protein
MGKIPFYITNMGKTSFYFLLRTLTATETEMKPMKQKLVCYTEHKKTLEFLATLLTAYSKKGERISASRLVNEGIKSIIPQYIEKVLNIKELNGANKEKLLSIKESMDL